VLAGYKYVPAPKGDKEVSSLFDAIEDEEQELIETPL